MKQIIKQNKIVFILLLIIWIALGILLLVKSKSTIHLSLNTLHSDFFDIFFKTITNLGDGLVPVILTCAFLFISVRKALMVGCSGLLGGLLAQSLKRLIFKDIVRPKAFFQDIAELYFVPGLEIHSYFSFPSGHATTAFALALCLIYFSRNKFIKILVLLLAILTAYSRIYLSQHFLVDVYFGSMLGILISIICIQFIEKLKNSKLDKPLINLKSIIR